MKITYLGHFAGIMYFCWFRYNPVAHGIQQVRRAEARDGVTTSASHEELGNVRSRNVVPSLMYVTTFIRRVGARHVGSM